MSENKRNQLQNVAVHKDETKITKRNNRKKKKEKIVNLQKNAHREY